MTFSLDSDTGRRAVLALGELQDEVPRMPNLATTDVEEPLLETRQRQAQNGQEQGQSAQETAEVVADDPEE